MRLHCLCSLTRRDSCGGRQGVSPLFSLYLLQTNRCRKDLLVLTDDPTQSTLTLTLTGQAFIPLTTFPERLALGNQNRLQSPLTKRVSLHVQENVRILGVRTTSEHLKVKLEDWANSAYGSTSPVLYSCWPVF